MGSAGLFSTLATGKTAIWVVVADLDEQGEGICADGLGNAQLPWKPIRQSYWKRLQITFGTKNIKRKTYFDHLVIRRVESYGHTPHRLRECTGGRNTFQVAGQRRTL